jgi:hypothetical protein
MRSASRCRKFRYDILLTQVRSGGILEYGRTAARNAPLRKPCLANNLVSPLVGFCRTRRGLPR